MPSVRHSTTSRSRGVKCMLTWLDGEKRGHHHKTVPPSQHLYAAGVRVEGAAFWLDCCCCGSWRLRETVAAGPIVIREIHDDDAHTYASIGTSLARGKAKFREPCRSGAVSFV